MECHGGPEAVLPYWAFGRQAPRVSTARRFHASVRGRHATAASCGQIREPAGQSRTRGAPRRASTALHTASLVPRPGDGTSHGRDLPVRPHTLIHVPPYAAAGASLLQRKVEPS